MSIHPCPKCGNNCKGKICMKCHLKLMKEKRGICVDCNIFFEAKRNDGTFKKRCNECQINFNNKFVKVCECGNEYVTFVLTFNKCNECFKNNKN